MQTQVAGEFIGIWDAWRAYEKRAGKPFRFYRAYPLIGRGSVEHDPYTYEECVDMFEKSLQVPILKRFSMWLNGVIAHRNLIHNFTDRLFLALIGAVLSVVMVKFI